jgi:hypothetical protein
VGDTRPQPGGAPETGTTDEACGELIGDGTNWRRAIYHHRRLASDPNVSDKEARSAANCMVLHPACHDDPVEFYNLQKEVGTRIAAGEGRLMFITLAASLGLSRAVLGPIPAAHVGSISCVRC